MKKNKLWLFAALFAAVVLVFTACGNNDDATPEPEAPSEPIEIARPVPEPIDPVEPGDETVEVNVFLIAHSPAPASTLNDGSFNQGAQDGILRFAAEFPGTTHNFLQPHEASDEARIDIIADAVEAGANVIVLPGFHFENSLYVAQDLFPETKFILLDASPRNPETDVVRIEANVAAIHYAEEQSGFLAGYAAVMEGYRTLGFLGGAAVPAVVRFGSGFVQGAEFAAQSLGLAAGEVVIDYAYLGGFGPAPEHQTRAAGMFATGTEVIFVAAGGAGLSVMAAAEAEGGSVIGVDVDQYHLSDTIVTSALKGLETSVFDLLVNFTQGNFPGGVAHRYDAMNDGVGLAPASTSRLSVFTQEQYNAIFAELAAGNISVDATPDPDFIPATTLVTVNVQ